MMAQLIVDRKTNPLLSILAIRSSPTAPGDRFVGSCPCLDVLRRALASFFPSPATRLQLMARLCVLWIVCYLVTTLAMGPLLLIRDDARVHARYMMMQDMPSRS